MRYAIALMAAALALPAQAQAQDKPAAEAAKPDAREAKLQQAMQALKQRNPGGAIALLDPLLADFDREYPATGPHVFCGSDVANVLMGLFGAAASGKDSIALTSTWCYALWAKGYALVELGRLDEAVAPLTRAARMMPDNAQFHTELGYVHQALKHWEQSKAAYEAAASAAERMTDKDQRNLALRRAWFGMGYNEIELGQYDAAEKHMKQALEVAPGDAKILNELEYIRQQRAKAKPN